MTKKKNKKTKAQAIVLFAFSTLAHIDLNIPICIERQLYTNPHSQSQMKI